MAETTNYIGVAMGLDVSDLKSGLAEASKSIGKANADFRSATSGLDDWTKSVEGISAKVTQLDTVLTAQKKKLAGLTAEYEKVAKEQGENSVAAQNLYIKMKNQEAVVKTTEREYKNYKETLDKAEAGTLDLSEATLKAGKAVDNLGNEANETGGSLDGLKSIAGGVVKGIAALGTAVVGMVGGFLSLAESTREAREDMAKLTSSFEGAKLSGESAKSTFKTLYGVIGETDTAVEAAQQIALLADSEEQAAKWAEQAANVTATFGDALKPETFFEAANETIKLGEATGAFTQMLEGTGVNVEEFNAHLASLNTEQEKQAYMLEVSQKAMGDAGAAYRETAGDIIEAREAEAELSLAMQELGAVAEPIMTTLKLLAVDLLESIKPFVDLIGEGLKGAFEGAAGATDQLAEGIGGILNAIIERLTDMIPTILEVVMQLIPTIATSLLDALPQLLDVVIELAMQVINLLAEVAPQILAKIVEIIPLLINKIIEAVPQLLQAAITLLMAIVQALPTIIKSLIAELPKIIDTIIKALMDAIPMLLQAAIQLFLAIIEAIPEIQAELIRQLPTIITTIIKGLIEGIPQLIETGAQLLGGLLKGLVDPKAIWKSVKSLGKSILDGIKSVFKIRSPSKLMEDEVGEFLGEGIGVGLLDSMPVVKKQLDKFSEFVTDNLGNIKTGLDISTNGSVGGTNANSRANRGTTVIDARQTVNFNGKLSRRKLKQVENDNWNTIKLKGVKEGLF